MDVQSRLKNAPVRTCDWSGSPKSRPRSDLGMPHSCQERPGTVQKKSLGRSPNAPEPSRSSVQASLEQRAVSHTNTERCFAIFVVVRKLRYAFRISFYSVLLASHAVSSERVHAAKNIRILGISASQIELGSVRAAQNRARAAQSERQNAKKTHGGKRFF